MSLTPLTGFEILCVELMNSAPKTHATHCFRSALHHLERSAALIGVDNEMAAFRAITAEEEASTGLIRCLIDLGYPESNRIKVHDHVHKQAVFPFLKIIGLFFGQSLAGQFANYRLHIQEIEGERRLTVGLPIRIFNEDRLAYPHPPLNFFVSETGSGLAPEFEKQMEEFLAAHGGPTIRSYLKGEANTRNLLLYASPKGYPDIKTLKEAFVLMRRKRVLTMIQVFLLIYPYPKHQAFVAHGLSVFLKLIDQAGRRNTPKKPNIGDDSPQGS